MARHCNECESSLPANAKFCMECGAKVATVAAATNKKTASPPRPPAPVEPAVQRARKRPQPPVALSPPTRSLQASPPESRRQLSKVRRLKKTSSAANQTVTPKESLRELAMQSLLSAAQQGTVPEQLLPYLNQLGIRNGQLQGTSAQQNPKPVGRPVRPVKPASPARSLRRVTDGPKPHTKQPERRAAPPNPNPENGERRPRLRPISLSSDRTLQSIMGHSRERGLYTSVAAAASAAQPKPRSGSRLLQRIQRQESVSELPEHVEQSSHGHSQQARLHQNRNSRAASWSGLPQAHSNGHSLGDSDADVRAVDGPGVVQDEHDDYAEADLSGMLRSNGEDLADQDFSDLYETDLSAMLRRPAFQESDDNEFLIDQVSTDPDMSAMLRGPQQPMADPSDISAMFRRNPDRKRASGSESSSWQRPVSRSNNGGRGVQPGDSATRLRDSATSHSDVDALDLSDIMNRTRHIPSAAPTVGGSHSDTDQEFLFQQQNPGQSASGRTVQNSPAASESQPWPAPSHMPNLGMPQSSSPSITPPPGVMVPAPVHPPFVGPPFSFSSAEMDAVAPSGPVTDSTEQAERFPEVTLPPPSVPGEVTPSVIDPSEHSSASRSVPDTSEREHRISPEDLERRARQAALRDLFEQRFSQATAALQKTQEPSEQKPPRQLAKKISKLEAIKAKETDQIAAALKDIGRTRSPAAVEILREYAEKGPLNVRAASIEGLAGIDHASARLGLFAVLKDPSQDVVDLAIRWLITSRTTESLPALLCLASLNSRYATVLLESLQSVDEQSISQIAEPLKTELTGENVHCASLALNLLSRLQGAETVKVATKLLKHPAPEMRVAALESLAFTKMKQSVRFFNAGMRDPDGQVRAAAATALGAVSSPKSISLLIAALHDRHQAVRRNAAKTLNRMEDPDRVIAAAASKAVADQTDPMAMEYLLEIVGKGGTDDALETLQRYLTDDNLEFRHRAINTLRKLKTPNAAPILRPFLSDPDHETRELAVRAIGSTGDKSVLPMLRQMLKSDQSDKVRAAAARSLGDLKDRKALTLLEEALHDVRLVACQAVIAMGTIGQKSSLPALFSQLRSNASEIRYQACNAVAEIGDGSSTDPLLPLLDDKEPMVRRAAELALEKLGGSPSKFQRVSKRLRKATGSALVSLMPSTISAAIPGGPALLTAAAALVVAVVMGVAAFSVSNFGSPSYSGPVSYVLSAGINSDASRLAAIRRFDVLEAWNVRDGALLSRLKMETTPLMVLPDKDEFLVFTNQEMLVWNPEVDAHGRQMVATPFEGIGTVSRIQPLPDGKTFYLIYDSGFVSIFDLNKRKITNELDLPADAARTMAISPDQEFVAYGDNKGFLHLCSASDGKELNKFSAGRFLSPPPTVKVPPIRGVAFSSDASYMAIAFAHGKLVLIRMDKLETIATVDIGVAQMTFHPQKPSLIVLSSKGVHILEEEFKSHRKSEEIPLGNSKFIQLTPDAKFVLSFVDEEKDMWVCDLEELKLIKRIKPTP